MKKLTRHILLLGILFTFSQAVFAWDYPLEAGVTFVWFDHQSGYSHDALDIKKNYTTDITTPEWDYSSGRNNPFAFIKSQSNRIVKAKFWHLHDDITSMHIEAEDYRDGFGPLPLTEVAFTISSGSGESGTESFTADGSVHFAVRKLNVKFKWKAIKVNGVTLPNPINFARTIHDYYVLLAAPQAPMAEPWTEVLEYACDWAGGKSTNSSVLDSLTTKLYNDSELDYNGYQSHYGYDHYPNPSKLIFDLTGFLYDWYDADCQDCAMFLSILSSSVGASLTQTRRIQGNFNTKYILPIGWSSWITTVWNFHHIGWLSNVYDATIKLKPSNPRIPINENINNPYKTDLYGSGSWTPVNSFRLGQTDPYFNLPSEIQ